MPNLKYVLRDNKKKSDGATPIYLRITSNRKQVFLSTNIYIERKDWNEKTQTIRRSHRLSQVYNQRLQDIMSRAEDANGIDVTADEVKNAIMGIAGIDFIEYANEKIQSLYLDGGYWNAKNARVSLNKLIEFNETVHLKKKNNDEPSPISFKQINLHYINKFIDYLRTDIKDEAGNVIKKRNKKNTIARNLGALKRIFRLAERERIISRDENPFHDVVIRKERTEKAKLSIDEIKTIQRLDLTPRSLIWNVRNYFLFAFYTGGTRFGDVCFLKWKNIRDGRLVYVMSKTSVPTNVKLLPPAVEIIEHYRPAEPDPDRFIFPILDQNIENADILKQKRAVSSANALANKYLEKIRKRAGIDTHISFHIARHSFADFWRRSGGSLYSLSKMLRHSSLTITENYLSSLDTETVDEEMDAMFTKHIIPDDRKILKLTK